MNQGFALTDLPMFALAITSPRSDAKDTPCNQLETGDSVINIVSERFVEALNATSLMIPMEYQSRISVG